MNKKKLIIILIGLSSLLFIVSIIILLNTNNFKLKNDTSKDDKNQSNEVLNNEEETDNSNDVIKDNNDTNSNESNNKQEIVDKDDIVEKEEINKTPIKEPEQTTTENDVISYFTLREKEITDNEQDTSIRKKAKDTFVSIVDFIFYDKEIKGYTFKELTSTAKLKIIKLALTIDSKIDEYFPNYKDTIKDKYTSIKGKIAVKYLEVTSTLCEKVGSDTCNQAKEDFNTMKNSFGFTWDLIKELASSGSTKVKEFYESWRDSE